MWRYFTKKQVQTTQWMQRKGQRTEHKIYDIHKTWVQLIHLLPRLLNLHLGGRQRAEYSTDFGKMIDCIMLPKIISSRKATWKDFGECVLIWWPPLKKSTFTSKELSQRDVSLYGWSFKPKWTNKYPCVTL